MIEKAAPSLLMQMRLSFALMSALLPGGAFAGTYNAYCGGTPPNPIFVQNISSVFGEARPSCVGACDADRFHAGTDILNACGTAGNTVGAIEAGTVISTSPPSCTGTQQCIRIQSNSGAHFFDYVHVTRDTGTVVGSTVSLGQRIGVIQSIAAPHLHLNELQIMPNGLFRLNPQRLNALIYSDGDQPVIVDTTISGHTGKVIVVPEYSGTDGTQTPTPFIFRNSAFYVSGQADILVTARDGSTRKGVNQVWTDAYPIVSRSGGLQPIANVNITFMSLRDLSKAAQLSSVDTIYLRRNSDSDTYFPSNLFINWNQNSQADDGTWDTTFLGGGVRTPLCGFVKDSAGKNARSCVDVVVDNSPGTVTLKDTGGNIFTGATSSTTIVVQGDDTDSGIDRIVLVQTSGGSYSSTSTISGVQTSAQATFPTSGSLSDGIYAALVYNLSGVASQAAFIIATAAPSADTKDDKDGPIVDVIPSSRCLVIHARDTVAGIASISITGAGLSKTMSFPCGVPARSTDVYAGAFCSLTENSTYTYTATSCSGKQKVSSPISVSTSTKGGVICVTAPAGNFCGSVGSLSDTQLRTYGMRMRVCMTAWPNNCNGMCDVTGWDNIVSAPIGSAYCGIGPSCCRVITWDPPLGYKTFSVTNSTNVASRDSGSYEFAITTTASEGQVSIAILNSPNFTMAQGQATSGTIDVAQIGQGYPTTSSDGVAKIDSPFTRLHFSLRSFLDFFLQLTRNLLRSSSPYIYSYIGSDAVLNSATTLTFTYVDTVNTDTTTVRIYMFDGVSWSSAGITSQTVSYTTSTQNLTVSGSVDRTGLYATLYQAHDSSAPVTTFAIQGSSFNFDGALFVSTDAYIVLTATDPAVSGFASSVASVTYRIDPTSGSAFSIYTSSIPVQLGTHVVEYRSLDYATNAEIVKTATFTVTAGTAMRGSSTAQVPGVLLNGFLGSGAKLEIESRAENSLALLVSSANRQALVSVDNLGQVGFGVTPQANLNIGAGAIGLQLRSGNSTSSVMSNQIAFGYDGDYSMRHLMRTEHSTAAHSNKIDFLVWNTGAASTTTMAGLNVLSLQGIATASKGSFHVQPVGEPDAEVEVSNGLSTGGGTMQRLQVVAPSSRRFKTDIKDLSEKDEDRALSDVAGLKHARFRYKVRQKDGLLVEDPAQALHTGLIYEEAPESIREGGESVSTSERLVNVELALKASMRRLEELQRRYELLKARRRKP